MLAEMSAGGGNEPLANVGSRPEVLVLMLERTVGQDFPRALCCYDRELEPGSDDEELSVEVL